MSSFMFALKFEFHLSTFYACLLTQILPRNYNYLCSSTACYKYSLNLKPNTFCKTFSVSLIYYDQCLEGDFQQELFRPINFKAEWWTYRYSGESSEQCVWLCCSGSCSGWPLWYFRHSLRAGTAVAIALRFVSTATRQSDCTLVHIGCVSIRMPILDS